MYFLTHLHVVAVVIFLSMVVEARESHLQAEATWYISPFGSDQNNGNSPQTAFKTLLKAVNVSADGNTINGVSSGDDLPDWEVVTIFFSSFQCNLGHTAGRVTLG